MTENFFLVWETRGVLSVLGYQHQPQSAIEISWQGYSACARVNRDDAAGGPHYRPLDFYVLMSSEPLWSYLLVTSKDAQAGHEQNADCSEPLS